jgi:2-C-methyl-D-erythritol 2,4-cyclodiphosphate synthase
MNFIGIKNIRIGKGFDVHALVEGRPLVIGGVNIPYDKGLNGHSDADVLMHAVCDAVLGAANLGDIGVHFPPEDMQYKDQNSAQFLQGAAKLLSAAGFEIINIDSTIIAEAPKMRPYVAAMQSNIAQALSIDVGQISIKATTTEKLGFTGRGEGIAADAIVLICRMT